VEKARASHASAPKRHRGNNFGASVIVQREEIMSTGDKAYSGVWAASSPVDIRTDRRAKERATQHQQPHDSESTHTLSISRRLTA